MKPGLDALAQARTDVEIVTLDVEESPRAAEMFGVRSMPTLILFRGGVPKAQLVGAQSRDRLDRWLTEQLK